MIQAMSGGAGAFEELGLNFMTLVHGEQEFEYLRPVYAGDSLTGQGRISNVEKRPGKRGGEMTLVTMETEATDAGGKLVFFSRNTLISRRMA